MQQAVVRSVARAENGSVIFLGPKQSDTVVPIIVRKLEEESILVGMSRLPFARPLAHDLFVTLLQKCAGVLKKVEIYDYKDELFYARAVLKLDKARACVLDARPSDAVAIATRLNAPIYISNKVIKHTAIPISAIRREERDAHVGTEVYRSEFKIDQLEYDLQKAVETENYEEAARIRDKIQRLR